MRRLACLLLVAMMLCSIGIFTVRASSDGNTTYLNTDTTWAAGSFHKLSQTLVIPAGITLTIEQSVWIDLWDCQIEVHGTLNASGTVDNKITFTSSVDRNSGLYAYRMQPDVLYFSSGSSTLLYTRIDGSRVEVSGSIDVINSTITGFVGVYNGSSTFTNSKITKINIFDGSTKLSNNKIDSLWLMGGTPIISNNVIEDCLTNGGSPTFTGNVFEGPSSVAYSEIHKAGSTVISENQFFAPISFGSENANHPNATLTNNTFTVSNDQIITVGPGVNVTISNNNITGLNNNQTAIALRGDGYYSFAVNSKAKTLTNIDIRTAAAYAQILNNSISNCQTGIDIKHSSVQIVNNIISNNTLGLKIDPAYYNHAQDDTSMNITQNHIANNSVGIEIVSSLASTSLTDWLSNDNAKSFMNAQFLTPQMFLSQANLTDYKTPINITSNNIYGNTQYNLKLSSSDNQTKLDVNVTNNYWGTGNQDTIAESIYDGIDDSNLGMATFKPFLAALQETSNPHPATLASNRLLITLSVVSCVAAIAIVVLILVKRSTKR
jgi:Right handed beta helix region